MDKGDFLGKLRTMVGGRGPGGRDVGPTLCSRKVHVHSK